MKHEEEKSFSKEQLIYLKKIAEASKLVEKVLAKHPQFDKSDLFRIALLRDETPESKLSTGIRRRVISNV